MRISTSVLHCWRVALLATLAFARPAASATDEFNPAHAARPPEPSAHARVIVKLRYGSAIVARHALKSAASATDARALLAARAQALGARIGTALLAGRAIDERTQVVVSTAVGSASLAARLAQEPDVEYAHTDRRVTRYAVPNDPLYEHGPSIAAFAGGPPAGQWYLRAPAGGLLASINAPTAWDITTGVPAIAVAVLDTGVRPDHPDLAGRLLPGYDMIRDLDKSNDGDDRDADASDPGDWISVDENGDANGPYFECGVEPSSWHGTMTSSLVGAATNNGAGMAGVAWNVKVLPVRVLGKCGGFSSDVAAGMRWSAGLAVPGVPANPTPARVINLSLGHDGGCSQTYMDTIAAVTSAAKPVVVVAAAGNSSGREVGSPGNCPGVIAVAGLRHTGTKVGFSDLGPQITISAPAGNCVNTSPGSACLYPILAATNTGTKGPAASSYTDSFNASLGTSFSSPLVAGTVALMLSVNASLTPAQVKLALQGSARPFPTGAAADPAVPVCHVPGTDDQLECRCTTFTCGAGMLDVAAAVAAVMPAAAGVIEFYNSILDNYFVTANLGEAASIDSGSAGPGWSRTGNTFNAGGSAQVCRFYGSVSPGPNSHFYTIDADECAELKRLQAATPTSQRRWNFESLDFASSPPVGGTCPAGKVPVYRAYNNGFTRGIDSNHRITRNFSAILEVMNRGWSNEGVVMCAPAVQ